LQLLSSFIGFAACPSAPGGLMVHVKKLEN
jgi:hypothetical protein